MTTIHVRPYWLDASAMVNWLAHEPEWQRLKEVISKNSCFRTTSICIGEALTVLKRKRERDATISDDAYYTAIWLLASALDEKKLQVYDEPDDLMNYYHETEHLSKAQSIDFVDAYQIVLCKNKGIIRTLTGPSATVFVTCDKRLAAAATQENLKVWDVTQDPSPPS